jgi:hypothetical protein
MSLEMVDCDAIIDARVRGESARSISRRLGVSLDDIFDVLDRWATQTINHKLRFHTLALELARLDDLHKVFDAQARTGDVASGALVTKIGEQRRILLGLGAGPRRQDQDTIDAQAVPAKTSTERIEEVINRLCLEAPAKEREPPGN